MDFELKKVIIFDLDDTLTESRQAPDREMATLLRDLAEHYVVCVMSGGSFEQFQKQLLSHLSLSEHGRANILLFPTSGAAMYHYTDGWQLVYEERLTEQEIATITHAIEAAIAETKVQPEHTFGETIQNRGDQVTYSALGQNAPLEIKHLWDPRQQKRTIIRDILTRTIPDFEIHIGGTTSIDIGKKGVNKAFGIQKLSVYLNIPITEMLYVGDALYAGGNDAVVLETGITAVSVTSISYTKKLIRDLIHEAR